MCQKFLLCGLSDLEKTKTLLEKKYPNDVYTLDAALVLVTNDKSTTTDIHNLLDFETNKITGFVALFTNIKGYYDTDFWEWLEARE